jgi:cell division protein FtsW (lipid II flippase)
MIAYMQRHEQQVRESLALNPGRDTLGDLQRYHDKQIGWLQQERLAHLLVMLFVCLFALLSVGFAILNPALPCFLLAALLILLAVAYLIHYYRLENGVQRWYVLSNEIHRRL